MKGLKGYFIVGLVFVLIFGSLSHFLYELSGENRFVALFCSVNESTWEHMKLVFFPMLYYAVFLKFRLKDQPRTYKSVLFGALLGSWLIPVIFYTYSGVLGYNNLILDILTFVVSAVIAFWFAFRRADSLVEKDGFLVGFLVIVMMLMFWAFTFYPPELGIFISPV